MFNALHGYDMQWPVLVCMLLNECLPLFLFACPCFQKTPIMKVGILIVGFHSCKMLYAYTLWQLRLLNECKQMFYMGIGINVTRMVSLLNQVFIHFFLYWASIPFSINSVTVATKKLSLWNPPFLNILIHWLKFSLVFKASKILYWNG